MVLRFKSSNKHNHKNDPNDLSNMTIEAKHNSMIQYFQSLQKSLPEKRKQLKKMMKEYKELRNLVSEDKMNIELVIKKNKMREEIEEFQKMIASIENREEEHNYFMDAGNILNNYFDSIEHTKHQIPSDDHDPFFISNPINEENENEKESASDLTLHAFIQPSSEVAGSRQPSSEVAGSRQPSSEVAENRQSEEEHEKRVDIKDLLNDMSPHTFNVNIFKEKGKSASAHSTERTSKSAKNSAYASTKITDFVNSECVMNKKELLDEYLRKVDKNYTPKLKFDTSIYRCTNCDVEMLLYLSDGLQICDKCGLEQQVLIESEKPSFKDPPLEAVFFSYKRINHFNELLAQFQAKESTEIPEDVFNTILGEIKKERIKNLQDLTTDKIKKYLKKNGLTKYTDHVAHILYKINGVPPPQLSKDLEDKLRLMFKEIQGPFMEVCPNDRKNLLNYSYVLHKFFELLELDDFKKHFPLLKDREKLYHTEMVWKKICEKLGWKFIKSI